MARRPTLGGYLREWRELFRPRDERFLELLLREARLAAEAGRLFLEHAKEPRVGFALAVSALESEGDEVLEEIVRALRESLVAPISGSDIYYLGNALDDVLDQLEDMAHEEAALAEGGIAEVAWRDPNYLRAAEAFVAALAELPEAIEGLFRQPRSAEERLLRLRARYGEGKRHQSLAYAALVSEAQEAPGQAFVYWSKVQWLRQLLRRVEKIVNALAGILATS